MEENPAVVLDRLISSAKQVYDAYTVLHYLNGLQGEQLTPQLKIINAGGNRYQEHKVSYDKHARCFAVEIKDSKLKVGGVDGTGKPKKVPYKIRFENFKRVCGTLTELKRESTPTNPVTHEKISAALKVANNITTGSGKTGDIAFIKLWCYLANYPCIVSVVDEKLKKQMVDFDKQFLPDEVARAYETPLFTDVNFSVDEICDNVLSAKNLERGGITQKNAQKLQKEIKKSLPNILNTINDNDRKKLAGSHTQDLFDRRTSETIQEVFSSKNVTGMPHVKDGQSYNTFQKNMNNFLVNTINTLQYCDGGEKDQSNYDQNNNLLNHIYHLLHEHFTAKIAEKSSTRYAHTTNDELFDEKWHALKKRNDLKQKPIMFLFDEIHVIKGNAYYLERAAELAKANPIAVFSATPAVLVNEKLQLSHKILLSPQERSNLGIGKTPVAYSKYNALSPVDEYATLNETSHDFLDDYQLRVAEFKELSEEKKCESLNFLDIISKTIDSSSRKHGLIVTDPQLKNDIINGLIGNEERKKACRQSIISKITELGLGLSNEKIEELVDENLEVDTSLELAKFVPLHGLVNVAKEFLLKDVKNRISKNQKDIIKSALNNLNTDNTDLPDKIKAFLEERYHIERKKKEEGANQLNVIISQSVFKIIEYLKNNKDSDILDRVIKNYPADKKLHEQLMGINFNTTCTEICENNKNIMIYPIKEFCNQYKAVSYFSGEQYVKFFNTINNKHGDVRGNHIGNTEGGETQIINNFKNMFDNGLIGTFIIDSKMAIGQDYKTNKVAIISDVGSQIQHPNNVLQIAGRGGRDAASPGKYFLFQCAKGKEYFNVTNLSKLNGTGLLEEIDRGVNAYLKDEENIINGVVNYLAYKVTEYHIKNFIEFAFEYPNKKDSFLPARVVTDDIWPELLKLGQVYGFNKETTIRVFTKALERTTEKITDISQNVALLQIDNADKKTRDYNSREEVCTNIEDDLKALNSDVGQIIAVLKDNTKEDKKVKSLIRPFYNAYNSDPLEYEELINSRDKLTNSTGITFVKQTKVQQSKPKPILHAAATVVPPTQQPSNRKPVLHTQDRSKGMLQPKNQDIKPIAKVPPMKQGGFDTNNQNVNSQSSTTTPPEVQADIFTMPRSEHVSIKLATSVQGSEKKSSAILSKSNPKKPAVIANNATKGSRNVVPNDSKVVNPVALTSASPTRVEQPPLPEVKSEDTSPAMLISSVKNPSATSNPTSPIKKVEQHSSDFKIIQPKEQKDGETEVVLEHNGEVATQLSPETCHRHNNLPRKKNLCYTATAGLLSAAIAITAMSTAFSISMSKSTQIALIVTSCIFAIIAIATCIKYCVSTQLNDVSNVQEIGKCQQSIA